MAKVEKQEFEKLKQDRKFLESCLERYEELIEKHFDSAETPQEFERFHHKIKSEVISKIFQKWNDIMGTRPMPPTIPFKATEKIDQAFIQLSKQFQQKMSREQRRSQETKFKYEALNYYNDEMDKFMKNNGGANLKKVLIAHTEASMAAMKMAKEEHKVSAATVTDLKAEIDKCFKTSKDRTKMTEIANLDPAIGIDLGTTMCCVMVYRDGRVELVPNRTQGNTRTTASYVAYLEDGSDTFGHAAKENSYRHPETTIYDAKRMIGRTWADPKLQNDIKHWPFDVVKDQNQPKFKIWGNPRYPHEVSARLLAQFRLMADEFLELPAGSVTKAVITVPAYFTEPQRRATSEAAEIAGLDVLNILSEPTAAAVAYSWERREKEENRKTLIYDLGGGTFDVSIAMVEQNNVDILAVDGDTHLGGQDFDQLLMNYCIEEFKAKEGIDLLEGRDDTNKKTKDGVRSALARLKLQCEKGKERLSASTRTTINVDGISANKDLDVVVTREKLEELVEPLVRKTLDIVDRVVTETASHGIKEKADIDDVILVGGSTRLPIVARLLSEHFNSKQLCKYINPDEAVAYGAAILAATLNNVEGVKQVKVQDVTPMSLGIDTFPFLCSRINPRNTKIPCEKSQLYSTLVDNQTEIDLTVLQGKNIISLLNTRIGEFRLEGIPPEPADKEKVKVTMKIDGNGLLHVKASALANGVSEEITITSDRLAIDKGTINSLKKEVEKLALGHAPDDR